MPSKTMKKLSNSVMLLLIVLVIGSFTQAFNLNASIERGKTLYLINCQSCHMMGGEGIPGVFPTLKNSSRVADRARMIDVMLNGMKGELVIDGIRYNGEMAAFNMLTNQEVSDVLNYIRNSFENTYEAVLPGEVKSAR